MFGKRARFITMIGAALGIPYAWFNEDLSKSVNSNWGKLSRAASEFTGGSHVDPANEYWPVAVQAAEHESPEIGSKRLQPAFRSFIEVLRFDITPRWVVDHWGRVSTVHAERDLEGMRVPLVTGTEFDDAAGSLTYYFDRYKRLRRITFHGETGDERRLVEFLTRHFALFPEPALGSGVYVQRWNAKPMNALRIAHAPVVRDSLPTRRFRLELELNDVTAGYGLSPEFQYLLAGDQAT